MTPVDAWLRALSATVLILLLIRRRVIRRDAWLLRQESDSIWTLRGGNAQEGIVTGRLVRAGYRSAVLVIIVIQADDTRLHRVAIWWDQVAGRDFSYLHLQLAYAAEPVRQRHWQVRLLDLLHSLELPTLIPMTGHKLPRRTTKNGH